MHKQHEAATLPRGGQMRRGPIGAHSPPDYSRSAHGMQGPAHGRVIGDTWVKAVHKSVHMLYRPPAWAVDLADLEAAERLGVRTLQLREQEQGRTYRASLRLFRSKGVPIDRGCGRQLALPLGYWRVSRGSHSHPKPAPLQLSLFGR